jgi:glycosyltransferase involved in cell wall biosynthesis
VTREERQRALRVGREVARVAGNAYVTPRLASEPLVSVIVPTYNWSSVLRYAVASALGQSYGKLEVLVVGDCCTDDSEAVVRSFGDSRIRWTNLAVNSGSQSTPNNVGLGQARGTYVAYLGHDDLWLPGHVAHLVRALETSGAVVGAAVTEAIGPPGSNHRVLAGLEPYEAHHWIPPSAVMHRRDVLEQIGGWREYREIVTPPDVEFLSRVIRVGNGLVQTHAMTVLKFNSAWRLDSYRTRRFDEQDDYSRRMRRERTFVIRELAAVGWLRARRLEPALPTSDPVPEVVPPGWWVDQWRQIRGLESHAGER